MRQLCRVLCFGDSNTYGYAPYDGRYAADIRWTGHLSAGLGTGWEIIEAGRNGRMIANPESCWADTDGLSAIVRYLEQPLDAIVLLLGSNDALVKTAAEIAGDMERLLQLILGQSQARILLLAPTHGRLMNRSVTAQLAPLYAGLAQRYDCCFADAQSWGIALSEDGGHFAPEGHAVFAQQVQTLLLSMLGGDRPSRTEGCTD